MKKRRTKFLTAFERTVRIEAIMAMCEPPITWYSLAKKMNRSQSSVARALCIREDDGSYPNITVSMLMACARVLNVSVGFLVDRKHNHRRIYGTKYEQKGSKGE